MYVMDNTRKFYIHSVLWNLIFLMTSGSIVQSFLLEKGFTEEMVNIFISVMQIIQVIVILSFSQKADSLRNVIRSTAITHLLDIPLLLFLFLLCFVPVEQNTVWYILLLTAGGIYSISVGIFNVLSYRLPYHIIDIRNYGKISAAAGVLIGIVCTLFSAVLTLFQNKVGFITAIKSAYLITFIMLFFFVIITASLKDTYTETKTSSAVSRKIRLLTYKPFSFLILPNLLRGFCAGMIGMAVTTGYYTKLIDADTVGIIILITNAASIIGCMAYYAAVERFSSKIILLVTSIVIGLALPAMVWHQNTTEFLIFYAVTSFFLIILNNAVPVTVTQIIDYDVAGQYNGGRILLNTLGTSAAGFVCVALFRRIGVLPTLLLSGSAQILSGIGYYLYLKGVNKKS